MLFNSYEFLLFFPIVCLLYFVIPKKLKNTWLLIASYFFYMCWNAKYAILMFTSTFLTYLTSIFIDKVAKRNDDGKISNEKLKKLLVLACCFVNLAILFVFKYANFAIETTNKLLSLLHISTIDKTLDFVLPVGISFYTFQALGYIIDVYRGDVEVERNFINYALFVSFFPQLVAGPIERSKNLITQINNEERKFSFENMRNGLLLMIWGFFLKLVISDRAAIVVNTVYSGDVGSFGGFYVIVATVLFAIQIYCDFAGYTVIAMGAAQVMGFKLMDNFNAPYFSKSVAEFWRRWHISLSTWFKDYLYIPLGGNRKGEARKYINLMIVFLVSGLWHGASMHFVVWGGLNGLYQIVGALTKNARKKACLFLQVNEEKFSHKLYRVIVTFILICFSWIFFRATSISHAFDLIKSMFTVFNPEILFNGALYDLGIGERGFNLLCISIAVLFAADVLKYKQITLRDKIIKQGIWLRWIIYLLALFSVLIFGVYGSFNEASFIYFQF